jgi:hypothetical protein
MNTPQYKLIKGTQVWDGRSPYEMLFPPESDKNVSLGDVKTLRSAALNIFSNLGPVRTAILDKQMYVVGRSFAPRYLSDDSAFAAEAVPWLLNNFYPVCNLQGEEFDFITTMGLLSVHCDVFGECFIYLTSYPDSGFPAIQLIPCWKVDQPRQTGALGNDNRLTGVVPPVITATFPFNLPSDCGTTAAAQRGALGDEIAGTAEEATLVAVEKRRCNR